MTPQYLDALITTAYTLLPPEMDLPAARPLLLAIALQESRADARRQIVRYLPESRKPVYGVARGFWQFEQAGGTTGVLEHPASARAAAQVCAALGFEATPATVHAALDRNDILACAFARLLLWTSPKALPLRGAAEDGWGVYVTTWRPGKPKRTTWDANFAAGWGDGPWPAGTDTRQA